MQKRFFILILLWSRMADAGTLPHHSLRVTLEPERHRIHATDTITWPYVPEQPLLMTLHGGLAPQLVGRQGKMEPFHSGREQPPFDRFVITLPPGQRTVTLTYGGIIHHPLAKSGEGVGHGGEGTRGIIAQQGVVLSGATMWYPQFDGVPYHTFDLTVTVPAGWETVSQGRREKRDGSIRWQEMNPQQEIYLVAGRFIRYHSGNPPVAMVYLRKDDPNLAGRYLTATRRYLDFYSKLLGDYPYAKFALVENFWETGYGMPSFTLLGPRVIRLPFLIDTAYPHEILHNWWGNGVFVAPADGNWSEGLTAYLADHLIKELAGHGADYRRDQLQAYGAFVSERGELPLARFTERHSGATQAVGYGKGMMFFHMLRREVGDRGFLAGLRRFYRDARFRAVGFGEIRTALESANGGSLKAFFQQWIVRSGAPELALSEASFGKRSVEITLQQRQREAPFHLKIPVAIGLADGSYVERVVNSGDWPMRVKLAVEGDPVCVKVDPHFELFRRLLPGEVPSSLSRLFAAEHLLLLVPDGAPSPLRTAYERLAQAWASREPGIEVGRDSDFPALPNDRAVFLLGRENRHLKPLRRRLPAKVMEEHAVVLEKRRWPARHHSFVLVAEKEGLPMAWLSGDDPAAVARLAQKVPHYGKYSYLVFEGAAAENRVKGQWPVSDSPLMRRVGDLPCAPPPPAPLVSFRP